MKALLLLLLCGVPILAEAQSAGQDNLRWTVSAFHDQGTNEDNTLVCQFESSPDQIRWIQKNGARVYDFAVTGVEGNWTDVSQDGTETFSVTFRGYSGWIKFTRSSGELSIQTYINMDGTNMLPYIFTVSGVSIQ